MPKVHVTLSRIRWEKAEVTISVPEDATHQECIRTAAIIADDLDLWTPDDLAHSPEVSRFHSNTKVID